MRTHGAPRGPLPCGRRLLIAGLREIACYDAAVDRRQAIEIRNSHPLVSLVHGLAHKTELDHRAIVLDEARVRRSAGGRESGAAAGLGLDGIGGLRDESLRFR